MSDLFWVDDQQKKTYSDLINDLNQFESASRIISGNDPYEIFLKIIHSAVNGYAVTLPDHACLKPGSSIGNEQKELNKKKWEKEYTHENLIGSIKTNRNWQITLYTSGTTGLPKKVAHTYDSITKAVRISDQHKQDVWAFAYPPVHMAGQQVFWQAFLNKNPMIDVFKKNFEQVRDRVNQYSITHISATPTFYRLIWNKHVRFQAVRQVSSGGERLTEDLKEKMIKMFPNARIHNIYASTEAGSLFASEGEYFKIPERLKGKIKFENNEVLVHSSLLGQSEDVQLKDGWYYTGDIVEVKGQGEDVLFQFTHRKNEMINVGGYKINPQEIEEELCRMDGIQSALVYGQKNSVMGNILCADIAAEGLTEKEIRHYLSARLKSYKIPRIIQFVEKVSQTQTGKLQR